MSGLGTLCFYITLFYIILYFFDIVLRCVATRFYERFLEHFGLEFKLFQIRWYDEGRLSRLFSKVGNLKPLRAWFVAGAYISALLIIPSIVLLVKTLAEPWSDGRGEAEQKQSVTLQPVIPGVNLPLEDFGYYFITLFSCSVIHEAGHAIAAVSEDVRVLGFGVNVIFVLPVAYVNLPTDRLMSLRPSQRLRVFSAGIWHNVALALFSYGLLFSIPTLCSPWFRAREGVSVYTIKAEATVNRGPTPLEVYDVITEVNNCAVLDRSDWMQCIVTTILHPDMGYCLDSQGVEGILKLQKKELNCCSELDQKSSLCFKSSGQSACLPVRSLLEKNPAVCGYKNLTCSDKNTICLTPVLESNASRLIQIKREGRKDFLFVGNPAEIYYDVDVMDYIPKYEWLRYFQLLPYRTEIFSHYFASFSGALAVLNVVPCFLLDGQHMTRVLADILCSCYSPYIRTIITLTLTIVGTILLILNVIVGLWHSL